MLSTLLVSLTLAASGPVLPTLVEDSAARTPAGLEHQSAEVELLLTLSETGEVTEVVPVPAASPVDPRFLQSALAAASGLRFTPAQVDGVPVPSQVPFRYRFEGAALPAVLRGQVRALGSKDGVEGAAITVDGVVLTTGPGGVFELKLPPGTHPVTVAAQAHHPASFTEELTAGVLTEVLYRIEPLSLDPYQTTVRDRPRVEVTKISLTAQEVREVPGTMGDPARVVMLLPGVAGVASGLAYPVVRGTQPASTQYFVDGVKVPTLYHLVVGPAVLHPGFVDAVEYQPGVPSAAVGRGLGGVVHLRSDPPGTEGLHAEAYADLINLGGLVQTAFPATGTKLSLAGRFSYTGALAEVIARAVRKNAPLQVDFADMQVRLDQRLGQGQLRLLWLASHDRVGVDPNPDSATSTGGGVTSDFHRLDLRLRHPLAGGVLELAGTWGGDWLEFYADRGPNRIGALQLGSSTLGARAGWSRALTEQLRLELGAEVENNRGAVNLIGTARPPGDPGDDPADPLRRPSAIGTTTGGFVSATWNPLPAVELTAGARGDAYHLVPGITHLALEPRLAVRWQPQHGLTLKAGAGLFHQAPTVLLPLPAMDLGSLQLGLQEGAQLVTGVEWSPFRELELGADVFFNPLFRSIELDLEGLLENRRRRGLPPLDPSSHGHSYGAELFIRKPLGGHWFGWLSYSFVRSQRFTEFDRYNDQDLEISQDRAYLPFAFEQEHVLNGALSLQLGHYTVGAVVHFNTGRPLSGQVTSRDRRPVTLEDGTVRWVRQDLDRAGRLPPFVRVDLRASRRWAIGDVTLEAYLDLLNASLQQETVAFEFGTTAAPVRIPLILPLFGVKATY